MRLADPGTLRSCAWQPIPRASLYQYFADKESVLLALVERDLAELQAEVEADLARLFQVAFERSLEGGPVVIDETIALVSGYLETRATRAGIEGVGAPRRSPDP